MYKFKVSSGKLKVTDPCYDFDIWCNETLDNVKNGIYEAEVIRQNYGMWGERISELLIFHESITSRKNLRFRWKDSNIGVDSGQAGFFDFDTLLNIKLNETLDKTFYKEMCNYTSTPHQIGTNEFGVVSSSGYGDGVYSLYVAEKNGEVVAAKIVFIDEENDEVEEF